jgi:PD-(D/E)XK nuclease superfamily domain
MNRTFLAALTILVCLSSGNATAQSYLSDKAQVSGQRLEQEIETRLRQFGIEIIEAKDWNEARLHRDPNMTAVIKNAPYVSIYGHHARIEFLLLHQGRQILIEVKRQRSPGSTDEKLPYVYENALANLALGREFVLIMEGEGWRPGAITWIKTKAAETENFTVFRPPQFYQWIDAQIAP